MIILMVILCSEMDRRKEQTPPAKVFSCQFGIYFMMDGQPKNKLLIIINMRKVDFVVDGRTDGQKKPIMLIIINMRIIESPTAVWTDGQADGWMDGRNKRHLPRYFHAKLGLDL